MKLSRSICAAAVATSIALASSTHTLADTFLNFGQMGTPDSFAFESFPVFTRYSGTTSFYTNNIFAYFTKTGLTGTERDQFEFWVGFAGGYSKADPSLPGSSWGVSNPSLGAEYYYNIVQPTVCYTCDGYIKDTISPFATITFPTGSKDETGFQANSNNFTYFGTLTNFLKINGWSSTIAPLSIIYSGQSYNNVQTAGGLFERFRGGLSLQVADFVTGFDLTPEFAIGVHHQIRLNNIAKSSYKASTQAFIGPAISYTGLAATGAYFFANLNFDYYHSSNLKSSPYIGLIYVQYLDKLFESKTP
ncbi:hypothetical protein [Methylobacterium sp. J-077]|uniref:hypothetical protein n=1 Tax=Methylobacterium sp. J-077 TaxID=2836656 RepID=UPI001FB93897|nr:hypothetical protein [Methylobacterium sp. J-077]MCJ2121195.1 hypothetical protein [Methylobacterium sp. J-077]